MKSANFGYTLHAHVYRVICNNSCACFSVVNCLLLSNVENGYNNCSLGDDGVSSYEDTCSFTCNTGYELTGSDTRTCQSDGNWSGSDVTCRRGNLCFILFGAM